MILDVMVVGPLQVNCYIVGCESTHEAAAIDPGDEADRIAKRLAELGLTLKLIILTHAHFDHLGAARELRERTGAEVVVGAGDEVLLDHLAEQVAHFGMPPVDYPGPLHTVRGGDVIPVGTLRLEVITTPGHSPGGISLYERAAGVVFSGDTLFWGSVGRTDLPGCDHAALLRSLKSALGALPDETRVLPGHEEETTIGLEKEQNPFFE
jgi:glyoxylase-like metal-dependent hydrolase (beta-lactamase superfamily II)